VIAVALGIAVALAPPPEAIRAQRPEPASGPAPLLTAARAEAMVARIDGRGGGSFESGTAFALADGVVVTAAHLTDGQVLLVTRCDGSEVAPSQIARSDGPDVALLVIEAAPMLAPPLAPADPTVGAPLVLPGFPAGGPLALEHGRVAGYYDDGGDRVMEIDPTPISGQSGSPLLDATGRVVGVLFGVEEVSGHGLAVPVSALRTAIDDLVHDNHIRIGRATAEAAFVPRSPVCP
jgi:S1-C subfamily serine protease